jgi:osmotically-inducible protein OsmY
MMSPTTARIRKEVPMHKPNNLLELDVKDELDWDPMLDDARVVVKADDGHVTLSGTVPSFYDYTRATEDAWTIGGVRDVDNELLVGLVGEAITDAEIMDSSARALDADKFVPSGSVKATADKGWVTLTGQVRNHFQRQAAMHAVRGLDGVLGVTDDVEISSEPIPSDVADRINKAFRRNAIIDDSLIDVTNTGHTIYLDGTASSYAARAEAENTAWAAPGVTDVVDRLAIIP